MAAFATVALLVGTLAGGTVRPAAADTVPVTAPAVWPTPHQQTARGDRPHPIQGTARGDASSVRKRDVST
jgi:hypothetical protein